MAYIPDEAIDRMNELSPGAWRLFCFLCRCRNSKTGRSFPSVRLSAEAAGVHTKNVFRLRRELTAAGWVNFQGDEADLLVGFNGSKNATTNIANIEDGRKVAKTLPESSENATEWPNGSENATPESQKRYSMVAKTLLDGSENATAYIEQPAKEPAKITKRESTHAREADELSPSLSEMVSAICSICKLNPDLLSPTKYAEVKLVEARLIANSRAPADVYTFAKKWAVDDWRGKQGSPPTLRQVLDEWERIMTSTGAVNHLGETWEEEKARRLKELQSNAKRSASGWRF